MKLSTQFAGLATLLVALALPSYAQAQKVGAANIQKIFTDVKETKDLETKLKARGEDLNKMQADAQSRLKNLQDQRGMFKAGTSEYDRANSELSRAAVQAQVELQLTQQELVREQKRQTKAVYDRVIAAVAEVAKEKGFTVIVAQIVPPEPSDEAMDRMKIEDLINLLRQQNLLYIDPAADITAEVTTRLDAKYTSTGGGASVPAPTPAPAGGTPPAPAR